MGAEDLESVQRLPAAADDVMDMVVHGERRVERGYHAEFVRFRSNSVRIGENPQNWESAGSCPLMLGWRAWLAC